MTHKSTLDLFHPLVRAWFAGRFSRTTEIQEKAWPYVDDLKTLFEVVTEFKHLVLYRQLTGHPSALSRDPG